MENELEYRSLDTLEIRTDPEDDDFIVQGYLARFNTLTELWPGRYEKIDRNAFNETISDGHNILLVYNHNSGMLLATTRNGTLTIESDDAGLRFKAKLNKEVSYAHDVFTLVKSGEIRGCSIGFYVHKHEYVYDNEADTVTRTILKAELLEGTITPMPAYDSTSVQARAKDIWNNAYAQEQEQELRALSDELALFCLYDELEEKAL